MGDPGGEVLRKGLGRELDLTLVKGR
jgi:hypothetical protein